MEVRAIKTKIFKEKENLLDFVLHYVKKIPEGSVLVVTSKIVALAEGRTVPYESKKQKAKVIKQESEIAIKSKFAWLTIKDGIVMASAGVDESNADGKLILLPKDSFKSAANLRQELKKKFHLKKLGVLITDSRVLPLRRGVTGVALGYAGFKGARNYIGDKDIFGKKLKMTKTNIADSLATAAVMCMGEGKEQQPLALIKNSQIEFAEKINKNELKMKPQDDLYLPLLVNLKKKR